MITPHSEGFTTRAPSGTQDDGDDRDDEHARENEAPIRWADDQIEAPEEFEADEDSLGHPEEEDDDDEGTE
jgi:hypothetical protein